MIPELPIGGTEIVLVVFAIVLIILVVKGVRVVPQSQEWTVERFGRYVKTLRPGLNVINPLFSNIGQKVSMRERVIDVSKQSVIFKDNATAEVDAIVFAQVVDTARAAYQVGVLKAVMALRREAGRQHEPNPFCVVCGTSAGAINAAALACRADDPQDAVDALMRVWMGFHASRSTVPTPGA